mmetsp:Transcript_80507/g.223998  ORF Transcript_80507/g.223998 Transcript_80507/m.223998 type:complete len:335 (+) Transcript_80507:587-1591(+)
MRASLPNVPAVPASWSTRRGWQMMASHQWRLSSLMGTNMYRCASSPPGNDRVHRRTLCQPCSPSLTPPDVSFWKKKVLARYISPRKLIGAATSITSLKKKSSTESLRHCSSSRRSMSRDVNTMPSIRSAASSSFLGRLRGGSSMPTTAAWGSHQRSVASVAPTSPARGINPSSSTTRFARGAASPNSNEAAMGGSSFRRTIRPPADTCICKITANCTRHLKSPARPARHSGVTTARGMGANSSSGAERQSSSLYWRLTLTSSTANMPRADTGPFPRASTASGTISWQKRRSEGGGRAPSRIGGATADVEPCFQHAELQCPSPPSSSESMQMSSS